jgi:hypothetical protein
MNLMAVVEQRIKAREEAKEAAKNSVKAALLNTQTILNKLTLSQGERKEFEASNLSLATKLEMLKTIND